jgi:hypothetical protein
MKNLALALVVATTVGGTLVSTAAAAKSPTRVYRVGYPPAYFAPAHYDSTPYRGVVSAPYYYGWPFYNDWQLRWHPRS